MICSCGRVRLQTPTSFQGSSAGTNYEPFVAIVWSVYGVHVADKVERILSTIPTMITMGMSRTENEGDCDDNQALVLSERRRDLRWN